MKHARLVLKIFLISLLCAEFSTAAENEAPKLVPIKWGLPSGQFSVEKDPFSAFLIQALKGASPNYDFVFFNANVQRILMQIKNTDNTCFTASLEDRSRLQYSYWTSYGILPPPVVIMKKDAANKLNIRGDVISLKELIKNRNLKGAAANQRSFGPQIDKILSDTKDGSIQRGAFDFFAENILEMIANGRVDYTLEHRFIFESLKKKKDAYKIYAIQEASQPLKTYFTCSHSPLGKEIVTKVDEIVRKSLNDPDYQNIIFKSWFEPRSDKEFTLTMKAFIKERMKGPDVE